MREIPENTLVALERLLHALAPVRIAVSGGWTA
jgi:hypothetical protein